MGLAMIHDVTKEKAIQQLLYNFSLNLRHLRLSKGKTIEETAKAAELSFSQIQRLESGQIKTFPRNSTIIKLAKYFGVRPEEFYQPANELPSSAVGNETEALKKEIKELKNDYIETIKNLGVVEDKYAQAQVRIKDLEAEIIKLKANKKDH
jgi:transcriptional regulator with XRE-family HTH domain